MKINQIILPAIITAAVISYFFYKKHQEEKTTAYITGGMGAIKTPAKDSQPDMSKMSPVELAAWNGDYSKVRELVLGDAQIPQNLKIRITMRNTETIYGTKTEKDSGYVRYGNAATTHYRDKETTVTSLEEKETITEYSIVHYTAMEADCKTAELLLKKGFDFTAYDAEGYAPSHIICLRFKYSERGYPYLKLLAEYGIDLRQKAMDSAGSTCLGIAGKRHDDRLAAYIKKLQQGI